MSFRSAANSNRNGILWLLHASRAPRSRIDLVSLHRLSSREQCEFAPPWCVRQFTLDSKKILEIASISILV